MRFFRGVLASAAVLGLLACGDDEGTGPGDGDQIDVTYALVSVDGEDVPATVTIEDEEVGEIEVTVESGEVDLDDDGTFTASLNVSANDQDLVLSTSGTYEITDGEIELTDDEGTTTAELDGDTLTYSDESLGNVELVFER